ncbi:MAG: hypothetical protein PF488_00065 [Patescibacteria group bacterium]|jgi:hypothetical protein|nr:hypothetical protein [Patescibacteria group bacterium]
MIERTDFNLDERTNGEMLDRNCLPHVQEFSNEELFADFCDGLPAVNCCSPYITSEDVVDESVDIENKVDESLIKMYKKRQKMQKKSKKRKQKQVISLKKKTEKKEHFLTTFFSSFTDNLNESFKFMEYEEMLQLAPAYPYKEGMKARYRK